MKKTLVLLAIFLIGILATTGVSTVISDTYESVSNQVQSITEYKAEYAMGIVIKNVKKLEEVKKLLDEVKLEEDKVKRKEKFDKLVIIFKEIALDYKELSEKREEIRDYMRSGISKIAEKIMIVEEKNKEVKDEIRKLENELKIEKDEKEINALEKKISLFKSQEKIIKEFMLRLKDIEAKIDTYHEIVYDFIKTIKNNGEIYEIAADTLELTGDYFAVTEDLNEIELISGVTNDMQNTWEELDYMMEDLAEWIAQNNVI